MRLQRGSNAAAQRKLRPAVGERRHAVDEFTNSKTNYASLNHC
jgi:hypothetical protein